jgi:hypothetical protein
MRHTDRDYYMLTVSMRLLRRKRIEVDRAEAAESLERYEHAVS